MKRKCGFTLIELLVVIAIIAMLFAILTPSLQRVKDKAGLISCANNQHQIVIAVTGYMSEWDDLLPQAVSSSLSENSPSRLNSYKDKDRPDISPAYASLGSFLPTSKVFNCPVSSFDTGDVSTPAGKKSYQELYQNPNSVKDYDLHSSYQMLWSYQGFNNTYTEDSKVKPFTGSWLGSGSDLLLCETMSYSSQPQAGGIIEYHWTSTHRIEGASRNSDDNYPYFYREGEFNDIKKDSDLRKIRLNAAYLDGRVERYVSGDTYIYKTSNSRRSPSPSYLIPKIWQ